MSAGRVTRESGSSMRYEPTPVMIDTDFIRTRLSPVDINDDVADLVARVAEIERQLKNIREILWDLKDKL